MEFKTIEWKGDYIRILDQRRLPEEIRYLHCKTLLSVIHAIRSMAIRGAPALGVAASMGIALAAQKIKSNRPEEFKKEMKEVCIRMEQTRPTAKNLFWAIQRMNKILTLIDRYGVEQTRRRLVEEALKIEREDMEVNRRIGEHGKRLIKDGDGILTHCNAGALATAGYGTALGVIYAAWNDGKKFQVYVDETRPLLQGARLTAWELIQEKIPVTVITDNMAGVLMAQGKISLVIVGADRIARNGDSANKIGTYSLAVLSRWHRIPFYIAAPISTIDLNCKSGKEIPIEERPRKEITHMAGKRIMPPKVMVWNPGFDVTPHTLIDGIITEEGILRRPFRNSLRRMKVE